MAKYELNDIQKNNLVEFMKRVNLTGAEVPAWSDIMVALSRPIVDEEKETN